MATTVEKEGPSPRSEIRSVHYTVGGTPGFIPAGVVVTGVEMPPNPAGVGFIPGRKPERPATAPPSTPAPIPAAPVDARKWVCSKCGKSFANKKSPARSLTAHVNFVHNDAR